MAEKHNFRSAFNGFHREDVVRYIEFITSKHNTRVNQLTAENDQLKSRLAEAEARPSQDPLTLQMLAHAEAERDDYKGQLDARTAEIEQLKARCAELERQLAESVSPEQVQAMLAQAKAEADARVAAAMAQIAVLQQKADRELEAYRRAERTERMARERAELVYNQANAALTSASSHVEDAADQIGSMADLVIGHLEQLRTAVAGSKNALRAAADSLHTIRPDEEA